MVHNNSIRSSCHLFRSILRVQATVTGARPSPGVATLDGRSTRPREGGCARPFNLPAILKGAFCGANLLRKETHGPPLRPLISPSPRPVLSLEGTKLRLREDKEHPL
jgi:hypothetical protein